jgi:DUF1365 family protein
MIALPMLMLGKVMHKRLTPKVNGFTYGMYYLVCPLSQLAAMPMKRNRFGVFSFYDKDHGPRDGSALEPWIRGILAQYGAQAGGEIVLITLPRVLGYVFNPVSFWLCHDTRGRLRAVLCEVNNTFGESHNYLCMHGDRREITVDDWLTGEKFFHVSPFLQTEGHYRFRFVLNESALGIWIDHDDAKGERKLLTALTGRLVPMSAPALRSVFWRYPLVTLKAVALIHWQAIKLFVKGVRYVPKPIQRADRLTAAGDIKKM